MAVKPVEGGLGVFSVVFVKSLCDLRGEKRGIGDLGFGKEPCFSNIEYRTRNPE
jgi:hypothetical protein